MLRTALRSVATPDFDAYHDLMTARGCTLLDAVDEECRDRWDFIDFGYSKAAWEELPLTEKARAYWNTLDEQKKRWLAVDLSSVRVGTDPKAIPRKGEGMIMSYSFYRPPGGFEPFLESAAPVALVHFDLTVPKGVAPLTFCFTFDVERRKWYPWWTLVQHSNAGPACKIRF